MLLLLLLLVLSLLVLQLAALPVNHGEESDAVAVFRQSALRRGLFAEG